MPARMTPAQKAASAQRRNAAKVVMNRNAVTEAELGIADGLYEMAVSILAEASNLAPRDPEKAAERGVPMMADTGTIGVWWHGLQVHGAMAGRPRDTKAKGGQMVKTGKDEVVMVVGFTSPLAHLQELGTIKMNAHPFLIPALNRQIPSTAEHVVPAMGKRVRGSSDEEKFWAALDAEQKARPKP